MSIEPGHELLWRAAMDQLTAEEKIYFDEWLVESPEHKKQFEKIKALTSVGQENDNKTTLPDKAKSELVPSDSNNSLYLIGFILLIVAFVLLYLVRALRQ